MALDRSPRISWRALFWVYLPLPTIAGAGCLAALIRALNPEVTVVGYMAIEWGLGALYVAAYASNLIGLAALVVVCARRAWNDQPPTWSLVPAFGYYALVCLLLLLVSLTEGASSPPIWAI